MTKLDEILIDDLANTNKANTGETFYFDETNNIRKGIIGFENDNVDNLEKLFFVMGGISTSKKIDFSKLFDFVEIEKEIKEVKFRTFLKGKHDFLSILKSEKLEKLFLFLINNDVHIHFQTQHYLHFALIDILDSLIEEQDANQHAAFLYYRELQSDMTEVIFGDYQRAHSFLCKYEFPNVPEEKCKDFIKDLYDLYLDNLSFYDLDSIENFTKELLRQIIKAKLDKNNLVFLSGNKPFVICDGVEINYLIRMLEINDYKYFDFETTVEKYLKTMDSDYKLKLKMDFLDSKQSREIQISDVICGFVSKLYNFLQCNNDIEIIKKIKGIDVNSTQFKTLDLFFTLMEKSEKLTPIMFKKINPLFIDKRFDFLFSVVRQIKKKNEVN